MGGPNWYSEVISGGYPICSFRQFLAKVYRFATIQNVTDDRQTSDYMWWQARPLQSTVGQKTAAAAAYLLAVQMLLLEFITNDR